MGFRPAIIFTAVAVFLHNFGFSSSQSFIEHPQDDFQIKGGTVTFSCQATGLVNATYYWLKDGGNVTRGNSYVNSEAYLTITRVTFDDAGLYSCRASSNTVIITSNQARLTVEGSPEVVQPPSSQSPHVGQTASFNCKVIGNPLPTVAWYYKGAVLSNRGRIMIFDNGTLTISSVMKSDAGQYKLEAKNDLGVMYASVEMTVLGFPRFTISPFNKVVKENQSVIFSCAATSVPSPIIQWLLPNGITITSHSMPSGNVRVLSNNTLVIDKVAEVHGGIYKCVATNSLGSKQQKASLSVLFSPRFASHLQNITKTRGQELSITCPANGNPTPKFQWIFDGNVVENQQTLTIPALTVDNQGEYVCRVNNSMGVASSSFYLRAYTLPNIITAPTNVTVAIGSTANFHCQAQGDPTPSVTWSKSDVVIGSSDRYSVLSNETLSITMATGCDQGLFSCRAENAAGRDERKAYLVVTGTQGSTALAVCAAFLGVSLVVIVLLVLYIWRNIKRKDPTGNTKSVTRNEAAEDQVYEDALEMEENSCSTSLVSETPQPTPHEPIRMYRDNHPTEMSRVDGYSSPSTETPSHYQALAHSDAAGSSHQGQGPAYESLHRPQFKQPDAQLAKNVPETTYQPLGGRQNPTDYQDLKICNNMHQLDNNRNDQSII